jgi:CBS domain-containing protein
MTVSAILNRKGSGVYTLKQMDRVAEAAALLASKRIGAALVLDAQGQLLGVISERDIVRGLATTGADVLHTPVQEIMTAPVITCTPQHSVADAMAMMTDRRIRHLPVIDNGRLAGMVSIGDLVKARIDQTEAEAAALKQYIAS